jgi:hypothetical protein
MAMAKHDDELPPVPYQFIVQRELYHMAVRLYLDTVVERAQAGRTVIIPLDIVAVLRQDARALKAARERGEPI